MAGFIDAMQAVLTTGIDAAKQVQLAKQGFVTSNPYPNSSSPGGVPVRAGQGAGFGSSVAGVPMWLLLGGGVLAVWLIVRR